jgi:hypothetical protein
MNHRPDTEIHEVEAASIAGVSVDGLTKLATGGHIRPGLVPVAPGIRLNGTTGRNHRRAYQKDDAHSLRERLDTGEVPRPQAD